MGPQKHLDWQGTTRLGVRAPKAPFYVKMTKIPLVNPRLIESQNWPKSSQNNIFHAST